MKVLFINACVRENSRTMQVCRAYMEKYLSGEGVILEEVCLQSVDLLPLNGELLAERDADIAARDFSSERYRFAKQFAEADLILIGAPYWDFSFPSLLKVYFEHICVNGITFGYENGRPVSHCRAGQLVYITTAGGMIGASLEAYLNELNGLFGIPKLRLISAEGLDIRENDAETILKQTISEL